MFLFGKNIVGGYDNGTLYQLRSNLSTDFDGPIVRTRTFPNLVDNGKRVTYEYFTGDFTTFKADPGDGPLEVSLRWSDDEGATYGFAVIQVAGGQADYLKQAQWRRLGMARNRIFELSWSSPLMTALKGAFIDRTEHET